jgi:hypothetical protein
MAQAERPQYLASALADGAAAEVMWDDIPRMSRKPGRLRAAIDGFSQRLRYGYGKRISDRMITDAVTHLSWLGRARSSVSQTGLFGDDTVIDDRGRTVLMVYNIGHFPGETKEDWLDLDNAICDAEYRGGRVIVIVHTTPFRPSLVTPMQWEGVQLWPEWSSMRERPIRPDDGIMAKYSYRLEGAHTHLSSVVIDRLSRCDEPIVEALLRPGPGASEDRAMRLLDAGADAYAAQMNIDSPPPAPWLGGVVDLRRLRKIATKMRREMGTEQPMRDALTRRQA